MVKNIIFLVSITCMAYSFCFFSSEFYDTFFTVTKRILSHIDVSVSSLQEANLFAQKHFLLRHEEWFVHPNNELREKLFHHQKQIIQDLSEIGMIQALYPNSLEYDYALLMGSFKEDVAQRLDFLAQLLELGFTFETITLLGGQRPLLDFEKEHLPEYCTTEIQMMDYLSKQHLPLMHHQHVLPVNTPMIHNNDGTITRPTTETTLQLFAATAPKPGSCLVISNNPYIIRQTKVAQRILNQMKFAIEGAGPAFNASTLDIIMLMDEFARRLYEECKTTI
jgi:hypothetical protein